MKLKIKLLSTVSSLALLAPALVFAQNASKVTGILNILQTIVNTLVPIVMVLAVLYFFWGLAQYILAAGSEDAKDKGKRIMIGGVIALFVMVSIWGLITWLGDVIGVDTGGDIDLPNVNVPDVR